MSNGRKRTARRPAYSSLVEDSLAATAATPKSPSFVFPPLADFDDYGFDSVTGASAFGDDGDRLIPRSPGRPPKSR